MSGVAAIIHFDGRPVEESQIRSMTERMAFRGPDGISHWVSGSVAFGQCMMRTTRESLEAALPLHDESGQITLIMDGRVDNFEELRRLLRERGVVLRSRADEELVLKSYLVFGEESVQHLRGDFAIVVWDARRKKVFCWRDHFAHKPFHYTWNGKTLCIATEVAPLLDLPWVSDEINPLTVAEFVEAKWFSTSASFYKDIHRLPAAHMLKADQAGLTTKEYWRPDLNAECPIQTEGELVELYRELFHWSVSRKCRSHKPIACEVSGGLDSSAIFALAVGLERARELPAPGIFGYTLKIDNDAAANDLPYAHCVARHLKKEIIEVPPTLKTLDWYKDRVLERRDFMGYPNGFMNFGILEDAKNKGCAVLLNGTGGDEWLTGESRLDYADAMLGGPQSLWRVCRGDIEEFGLPHMLKKVVRYGLGSNLPESMKSAYRILRSRRQKQQKTEQWLTDELFDLLERRFYSASSNEQSFSHRGQKVLENMLYLPFRSWVYDLNDRDAAEMHIERREPFDDTRIVELAYTIPLWMFRQGARSKLFHRRAMNGLLPREVDQRKDKAVFSTVLGFHNQALKDFFRSENQMLKGIIEETSLRTTCSQSAAGAIEEMDLGVRFWPLLAAAHLKNRA